MSTETPLVGIIMGSQSDWDTMRKTDEILTQFGVPHECEGRVGAPHAGADGRVRVGRRSAAGSR